MKVEFGNELRDDSTHLFFPKKYISNLIKEEKTKKKKEKKQLFRKGGVKDDCDDFQLTNTIICRLYSF
jgi:hypothetical protein